MRLDHREVKTSGSWSLYIVECADGSLYTGISVDVERRVRQHNGEGRDGARYTAKRRPVTLVYERLVGCVGNAMREEIKVKRMKRAEKLELIEQWKP